MLCWVWGVTMMMFYPNALSRVFQFSDREYRKRTEYPDLQHKIKKVTVYSLVIMFIVIPMVITFHGAYFVLGWIPEDYGSIDSDGDFVTLRWNLSLGAGVYLGGVTLAGIGKLLEAKVFADERHLEIVLRDQIENCGSDRDCKKLAKEFTDLSENWNKAIYFSSRPRWAETLDKLDLCSDASTSIISRCRNYLRNRSELLKKIEEKN